jgi:hypothetical protein
MKIIAFKAKHIHFQNNSLKSFKKNIPLTDSCSVIISHERQKYVNCKMYQFQGTCGKTCRTHNRKLRKKINLKLHKKNSNTTTFIFQQKVRCALFNDAVDCWDYTEWVTNEWISSFGKMRVKRENQCTRRNCSQCVTFSTTKHNVEKKRIKPQVKLSSWSKNIKKWFKKVRHIKCD